jgi:hypothetical protein
MVGRPPKPTVERFWRNVVKIEKGCWLYGKFKSDEIYGLLSITKSEQEHWGRETIYAHMYSFILHKGPVPDGLLVCHSCDVRRCVNPDHLWAGTQKQNLDDMRKKNRQKFLSGKDNPMWGKSGNKNPMWGKKRSHSEESKKKMSDSRRGRAATRQHREAISRGLKRHYHGWL